MGAAAAIGWGAQPTGAELIFVRPILGVLNHRVRAVEYRNPCNDYRWEECWLYWTWCDRAVWSGLSEDGGGDHVCITCETHAIRRGLAPSGRTMMSACEVTEGTRWCHYAERWVKENV